MRYPQSKVLLFAKAPVPGQVKTRLIPLLGSRGAAALYRQLLESTVAAVADSGLAPVQCCCSPTVDHPCFTQLAIRHQLQLTPQKGGDLGARMLDSACEALARCGSVLLIGGDCPALQPWHLEQALEWLQQGADAVLGPAQDGGYVLLGLTRAMPELFRDMPWGSDRVLEMTRQRLRGLGWAWRELEQLWDVDRPEDVVRYRAAGGPVPVPAG